MYVSLIVYTYIYCFTRPLYSLFFSLFARHRTLSARLLFGHARTIGTWRLFLVQTYIDGALLHKIIRRSRGCVFSKRKIYNIAYELKITEYISNYFIISNSKRNELKKKEQNMNYTFTGQSTIFLEFSNHFLYDKYFIFIFFFFTT